MPFLPSPTTLRTTQAARFRSNVSGDSDIGSANVGETPTHAAVLPNGSHVFVTSAGSLYAGDSDVVTSFTPAFDSSIATGLGIPTTYTFPGASVGPPSTITSISESGNLVTVILGAPLANAAVGKIVNIANVSITGYDGSFPLSSVSGTTIQYQNSVTGLAPTSGGTATLPTFCSYLPDFVTTTENTAAFVANYGVENGSNCNLSSTDSVALLNVATNSITYISYLPPGSHPVALAETPDALNLYVLNQGNNTLMDLSPIDLSTFTTLPLASNPIWAVVRGDNRRLYVLTQGDGKLLPIDVATNTILPSQTNLSVGAGANFILYDPTLNRLYVTNPDTGTVYVYSTTGGVDLSGNPNDTPLLLSTIVMNAGPNPPCPNGCSPVSVAALPDGSRFYVASYASETACSDPNVGTTVPCIIPMLTVFDALSIKPKSAPSSLLAPTPSLSLLMVPQFSPTQYAVPPLPSCVTPASYVPGATRFRMFTTAAADSSHVYVSICDAGSVADVNATTNTVTTQGNNTPDTLVADIVAPFGSCTGVSCNAVATITARPTGANHHRFQCIALSSAKSASRLL